MGRQSVRKEKNVIAEMRKITKNTDYRFIDGYLYIDICGFLIYCSIIIHETKKEDNYIKVSTFFGLKRSDIDQIYWRIFENEEFPENYASLRVNGAFTAPSLDIGYCSSDYKAPFDYYNIARNTFNIFNNKVADFIEKIKNNEKYYSELLKKDSLESGNPLRVILEKVYQEKYVDVVKIIRVELDKDDNDKDAYLPIEEYCIKKLKENGELPKEMKKNLLNRIKDSSISRRFIK